MGSNPSPLPVGPGPRPPTPIYQTICLLCSNYTPGSLKANRRRRRRAGVMMETFITIHHKAVSISTSGETKQVLIIQREHDYALVKVRPLLIGNEVNSPLKSQRVCKSGNMSCFLRRFHACLLREVKTHNLFRVQKKKNGRNFSHFQHSRSHLMLPV